MASRQKFELRRCRSIFFSSVLRRVRGLIPRSERPNPRLRGRKTSAIGGKTRIGSRGKKREVISLIKRYSSGRVVGCSRMCGLGCNSDGGIEAWACSLNSTPLTLTPNRTQRARNRATLLSICSTTTICELRTTFFVQTLLQFVGCNVSWKCIIHP